MNHGNTLLFSHEDARSLSELKKILKRADGWKSTFYFPEKIQNNVVINSGQLDGAFRSALCTVRMELNCTVDVRGWFRMDYSYLPDTKDFEQFDEDIRAFLIACAGKISTEQD